MKQSKIIEAYNIIEKLSEIELTPMEQWNIYQLRLFLRPHVEFQNERVSTIMQKYSPYIDDKGMISGEKAQEYLNEMNELKNLEVELEKRDKIKIRFVKGITFKITEPLEDFVEFVAPEE